ncbi:MAG: ATP-binding protein, partial [Duodenibacillus sp.]
GYIAENLGNLMIYGTYPAVVQNFEDAPETLQGYTEALLFKDLFRLTDIRRSSKFVDLVSLLCYRIGSEINFDSLARDLGLNKETIQRYITLLELCSIIKVVPSFSKNLGNELKKGKKVYFTDLGIRNALIGDFSPLSTRSDAGAIWENFFFMEPVKMHDTLHDRKRMFFWRTKTNTPNELDFIEVRDQTMEAFECKLSPKAQPKPGEAFLRAYPECPIRVVAPENCLPYFGF